MSPDQPPRFDAGSAKSAMMETADAYRPRALLFKTLAMLWVLPTAGAVVILLRTSPRLPGGREISWLEWIQGVPIERWCAIGLIAAQLVWMALAVHYRRAEPLQARPGNDEPGDSGPAAQRKVR